MKKESLQSSFAACCAELNIACRDDRYLATLRVDGVLKKRRVFQSDIELADWTASIFSTIDPDLYVHLRAPAGTYHGHLVLDLARKLARQGIVIGIAEEESVCPPGIGRLQ